MHQVGGARSQAGCTTAGGRGESWPAKFARCAWSNNRIDGGSSHTPTTNGASNPRKPKLCSNPRKPKQWREWCECRGVHATVLSQALLAHQVPPPLLVFSGEGD